MNPQIAIVLNNFGNIDLKKGPLCSSGKVENTVGATKADWNKINPAIRPESRICNKKYKDIVTRLIDMKIR